MIIIWDTPIMVDLHTILTTLRAEVRSQGVDLIRHIKQASMNNLLITCPLHKGGQESKPSMTISETETERDGRLIPAGTCRCFTCNEVLGLPELISAVFGYQDEGMFGFKWLTQNFVNLAIEIRKPIELDMTRGAKKSAKSFVSEEELDSYRYFHPYMHKRKLTDRVIEYFDVGYDQATDSLTFPVHDLDGRVPFLQRRSVGVKRFDNEANSEKGQVIYGLYEVYKNIDRVREIWICESIIDALTCWSFGGFGVALLGAGVTDAQARLLRDCPVRALVEALDQDEAGRKGAEKLRKRLEGDKIIYRAIFPEGVKDINDLYDGEEFRGLKRVLVH